MGKLVLISMVSDVKEYVLHDIENLSNSEIHKVYKYIRKYLIAQIPDLKDPMDEIEALTREKDAYMEVTELDREIMEKYNVWHDPECDAAIDLKANIREPIRKCSCGIMDMMRDRAKLLIAIDAIKETE